MRRILSPIVALAIAATGAAAGPARPSVPEELRTRAELSGYRATSSYAETLEFLHRLARRMPELHVDSFGVSAAGRALPLVVVARDPQISPARAIASGKPVVLIQNGIHAGEIDGKDACLEILRDMALGAHRELLDHLVLLIVPIYNVDGHERVSPYNRPNQNGPELGMGFRTTADGHDLNRDHLKLETPEARALIRLFNAWRPHLHVDDHVTDGVDHDWVLTYSWVEPPQLPAPLAAWVAPHLAAALRATEAAGHRVGPYVSLTDRDDPSAGFDSYVGEPRYATGYYPLRNRPSILVENHSYKPYAARVAANRDFLLALLAEVAADGRGLVEAVAEAERRTVAAGRPGADPSSVVLTYEAAPPEEKIAFPVYAWSSEPSTVTGGTMLRYRRGEVREIEVPWTHKPVARKTVARPRGYAVLPGWPAIERRLADHGLRVLRLRQDADLDVETLRLTPGERSGDSGTYQGLTPLAVQVTRTPERRHVPAGALWIPADQPDFEVAVQLLEPEAPDSLVAWGLVSLVLERKEWIDLGVLEGLAREMLRDEATKAAWEQALADEKFAADRMARWTWWYRRTKYWDETVGLLPVLRVLAAPVVALEPWPGPARSPGLPDPRGPDALE